MPLCTSTPSAAVTAMPYDCRRCYCMHAKAYRTRRCHLTFLQVAPSLSLAPHFGLLAFASAHQCAALAAGKGVLQLLRPLDHVAVAAALQREMQARVCLFANLSIRPDIRICLSCLDVTRRWRLQCWIRRAAALLLKAAAAAASGELLPCRACLPRCMPAQAPLKLLPDDSWLFDRSAACRWIAATAGCWRR